MPGAYQGKVWYWKQFELEIIFFNSNSVVMSHDPQHGFYNHQADALMRRLEAMVFQAMQDRLFSFYVVSPLMGHGFPGTGNYYMFVFRFPIFCWSNSIPINHHDSSSSS